MLSTSCTGFEQGIFAVNALESAEMLPRCKLSILAADVHCSLLPQLSLSFLMIDAGVLVHKLMANADISVSYVYDNGSADCARLSNSMSPTERSVHQVHGSHEVHGF